MPVCGHVNKHFFNTHGKLEDLTCDLEKGHAGDHHAKCLINEPDPVTNEKGIVVQQRYREIEVEAFWNDMAGTPASEITAGEAVQLTGYQQDIVADILRRNPGMNAQDALKRARESEIWTAGNV